ncbi:MAG: ParB/RepB/Spo0J family partition protein [Planctomycetota bacterium]
MQVLSRRIVELTSHPQQGRVYNSLSDREFQLLKDDIARHGVRQPIEITSIGVIVDGHHRVKALQELGIGEVDVIICEEMTDDEIEERFVNANLLRRQLDPVTKARAIKRLAEIESQRTGIRIDLHTDRSFRDRLARLLGNISGRTVDRYLQLLRLERVIQDAVASDQLPMTTALKIESLPAVKRQAIAKRISAKEPAKKVVAEYLQRVAVAIEDTPEDLYHDFIMFLDASLNELAPYAELVAGSVKTKTSVIKLLATAAEFCERMRILEQHEQYQNTAIAEAPS